MCKQSSPSSNNSAPDPSPSDPLPLSGKTVLVTRSAGQSSQFSILLQRYGASVVEMPTLAIGPPSSWEPLDQAIAHLSDIDWLILTSTNGVDYFFERLAHQGGGITDLTSVKIAVVGQKTAQRLEQLGRSADFIPPNFVADALVSHFPERDRLSQLRLLFPRVETGGRDVVVKEFSAQGATVIEVPAYESGCVKAIAPEVWEALAQNRIHVITFASSKTVSCFHQLVESLGQSAAATGGAAQGWDLTRLNSICLASIGPQTSERCIQCFGRVDIEATDYTLNGLTYAIVQWSRTQP